MLNRKQKTVSEGSRVHLIYNEYHCFIRSGSRFFFFLSISDTEPIYFNQVSQ